MGRRTALRIVVTGGAGFLGRATIAAAQRAGHHAWSFDHAHGHDVLGDLGPLIYTESSELKPDVVIHLAGLLGTDELFDQVERAIEVNITGTARILEWCRQNGARYVGITMPPVFPSIYTATKMAATRLATAYHHTYGLPVAHVRAYNAYGPGQAFGPGHPQKIIPTFAVAGWRNEPIPVWGDGEQIVDLVHAHDLGRMLIDATGHGDDVIFDGGTAAPVTVKEIAHRVIDMTGSSAGIRHLPMRRGETNSRALAAAQGTGWSRLDWVPKLDWDEVERTVRWYRRYS
jgi:UDP-glucose 4-epimerase